MAEGSVRYDVAVIGGGPSGMMAAITAALRGRSVVILEKNEKPGKKLFITGKGRCNLTNACPEAEIFRHIVTNESFMYSSVKRFTNLDVMDFFEGEGLKLKTERGGRVFPVSDHSSDVIRTLENKLKALNVRLLLNTRAKRLLLNGDICRGVAALPDKGEEIRIEAESVVVATGGLSYPSTGSDGDGLRFAREAGIKITEPKPGLVPFEIAGDICGRLQGLSLRNVSVSITDGKAQVYKSDETGEMLFTHFGVSGPLILTASSETGGASGSKLKLHIDLKPALDHKTLDRRIVRDFSENSNKEFKNSLGGLLPSKLIPVITELSGIDPYKKTNSVTREERAYLAGLLKDLTLDITGTRGFDEAIITRGGVSVKEIDPRTFEAKRYRGLFFVGEVIDVDAHTGGFNLQIAWSTGHAAGEYV
ncbi:MAG: NAD(P)/FAD-dependent oxidoreductase [Lachnospiraceae bacterium]|nr:NAD(P)/FAD-dependent oxidoreductase [Lachnospiraceae bacterium]